MARPSSSLLAPIHFMRTLFYTAVLCAVGMALAGPAFALTVSPARVEITGDPGTTLHGEIEVLNEQEEARTFFTSFENFEPSGDSGSPHFIGAEDGLATWIQADNTVDLEPGERALVPFSITIPQDAGPGGYFAAIFFGSQAPGTQASGEISIGGKIGVLVLLRVSGEIETGGGLMEFSAKEQKRFFSMIPVPFAYRISNTGGDRVVPHGEITIKNTLGIVSAKLPANEHSGSVLPGSARKFEAVWEDASALSSESGQAGFFEMALRELHAFHFGWYTANLDLVWGDDISQTATATYSFFIIPWHLLLIGAIVIAMLWFFGRIGLRKYNRFIIARAKSNEPDVH